MDDDIEEMIEEASARDDLTEWETEFLYSIAKQYEETESLTNRQRAKLQEICDR
jgi:hypothetical protein